MLAIGTAGKMKKRVLRNVWCKGAWVVALAPHPVIAHPLSRRGYIECYGVFFPLAELF
jgi:hypothetical protein